MQFAQVVNEVILSILQNLRFHSELIAGASFPAVSIMGDGPVNEGENATFTVSTDESASNSRTTPLEVSIAVSHGGTPNFISGDPVETVPIPGGSNSASYTVATTNNNTSRMAIMVQLQWQ